MNYPAIATPPTNLELKEVLPNGHLMTPHDQRRRAALLADSPELSSRPPPNAGGGSGSVLGVLQEAHAQMSITGSSSSTTSSIHHNYGFDRSVEICIEDAIEVESEMGCTVDQPNLQNGSVAGVSSNGSEPVSTAGCCSFCKSNTCRNLRWRLKATFGGLTER